MVAQSGGVLKANEVEVVFGADIPRDMPAY